MIPKTFDISSLNGKNGFAIEALYLSEQLGASVSSAGDVNGDGINDVIIGAPGEPKNDAGKSYVIFGSKNGFPPILDTIDLNGQNGFTINGVNKGDGCGIAVSSAGDFNDDGIADMLIGAYGGSFSNYIVKNYVVFGRNDGFPASFDLKNLDGQNGFVIINNGATYYSHGSIKAAGDINADGISDIIIGSASHRSKTTEGQSYVMFGSKNSFPPVFDLKNLDGKNGFIINGIRDGDFSGSSVSGAGDVNDDTVDDLIIGAPGAYSNTGQSYVVYGNTKGFPPVFDLKNLDGKNGFAINGITTYDRTGNSVCGAGDINNDGIADVLIGANTRDLVDELGTTYVVFGANNFTSPVFSLKNLNGMNGFAMNGMKKSGKSGSSVSALGDVNKDGFDDVITGAPNVGLKAGQSYVLYGSNNKFPAMIRVPDALDGVNGFTINNDIQNKDRLGASVSTAGDFNGDGIDDILVGAWNSEIPTGHAYVIFGE